MTAEIAIPYQPRPLQRQLHNDMRRFNVINCHRRFGKTTFALMHAIRDCVQNKKQRPRYAFVSPLLKQSKTVCWDMLQDFTRGIPGVKYNQQELRVDFAHNQGRIELAGADSPDNSRGQRFDGVVLDEYAQMPATMWSQVLRPALTDRAPDSWAIFIGTPSGMDNNFAEIYEILNKNNISRKITSSDELTNNLIDDLENPSKETKSKSVKIKEIGHQTLNDTMKLVNNFIYNENK